MIEHIPAVKLEDLKPGATVVITSTKGAKSGEITAILDKYDPRKRVWLALDEWGTWWDVEPGSNPGFLFQQNTLRDALVAALNINIFVKHADRLKLANIAQMINVLQAMILTKDEKMVLTPTYHVFEMFKSYQDGT